MMGTETRMRRARSRRRWNESAPGHTVAIKLNCVAKPAVPLCEDPCSCGAKRLSEHWFQLITLAHLALPYVTVVPWLPLRVPLALLRVILRPRCLLLLGRVLRLPVLRLLLCVLSVLPVLRLLCVCHLLSRHLRILGLLTVLLPVRRGSSWYHPCRSLAVCISGHEGLHHLLGPLDSIGGTCDLHKPHRNIRRLHAPAGLGGAVTAAQCAPR